MVLEIIIIGAGLSGLSAALSLAPSNHKIRLYERHVNFDHEGWALMIHPPATKILHDWGLDPDILEPVVIDKLFIRDLANNTTLLRETDMLRSRLDLGVEWPMLFQDRADLHTALRAKVREFSNITWHAGAEIKRVFADSGAVELADGTLDQADLVIGADGIHSKAIDCIPRPNHRNYIDSVVRLPVRTNNCVVDVDLATQDSTVAELFRSVEYHRGAGYYHGDSSTGRDLPKGSLGKRTMAFSPIRQSRMININFIRPDQTMLSDQEWPWTKVISPDQFFRETQCDSISPVLQKLVRFARHFERWTTATRDCPTSFVKGKVVLAGDAAHLASPDTGAGACLGLEDAVVLGALLDTATVDNLAKRLQMYNTLRYERCLIVKYFGDDRPEDTGTAAEMLELLIPGAKLPASADFYRYMWVYDPLEAARRALREEDPYHRNEMTKTGHGSLELDLFTAKSCTTSILDWIRAVFCMNGS